VIISAPAKALASVIAARSEQAPPESAQMPFPAVASWVSAVVFTTNVAAFAFTEKAIKAKVTNNANIIVFLIVLFIFFSYDECLLRRQSFHSANSKLLKSANTQPLIKVL
jgi:hypothetical protein